MKKESPPLKMTRERIARLPRNARKAAELLEDEGQVLVEPEE
jgi:hypothetical protein